MTLFPREPERLLTRLPHACWAVAIAPALVVLLIAGVLPRVCW